MSLHQHSKTFSQGQWLSSRGTYECQNLHEYVHEYIVYLSTKFMTFMLVILQSYSVGKFSSTWFYRTTYTHKFWNIFVDIKHIREKYVSRIETNNYCIILVGIVLHYIRHAGSLWVFGKMDYNIYMSKDIHITFLKKVVLRTVHF